MKNALSVFLAITLASIISCSKDESIKSKTIEYPKTFRFDGFDVTPSEFLIYDGNGFTPTMISTDKVSTLENLLNTEIFSNSSDYENLFTQEITMLSDSTTRYKASSTKGNYTIDSIYSSEIIGDTLAIATNQSRNFTYKLVISETYDELSHCNYLLFIYQNNITSLSDSGIFLKGCESSDKDWLLNNFANQDHINIESGDTLALNISDYVFR